MPAKQYEVVRPFRRTDRRTGADSHFEVGQVYSGPIDASYLDPAGPDGRGPLIAEKSAPAPAAPSSDSDTKEK